MSLSLRPASEADWPAVAALARAFDPDDPEGAADWLAERQHFDTVRYVRRHYVAVDEAGQVSGYGAIEQATNVTKFRIVMVAGRANLADVGELLYARLLRDLADLRAVQVLAREYDHPPHGAWLSFLRGRGFRDRHAAEEIQPSGRKYRIVRLEKSLG